MGLGAGEAAAQASGTGRAGHVVLLGDSIFDNKAYVAGGLDVVTQLHARLPDGWRATLGAVDGAVTGDLPRQLSRLSPDATHLVVSIGGNDALRQEGILGEGARTVGEGLARLAALRERFRVDYGAMLDAVSARSLPVALCTIYDPRFPDRARRQLGTVGLTLFNDIITRAAFARGWPLIDLRLLCNEDADFANPIEPSVQGGGKIATEIARMLQGHDPVQRRSEVFAGG
ncbi:SGNH/GDSL hydrolase family protein [Roseomonas xinghualingensis]|uniref:SGNH/GDSL hydrolase family protein n=1 Tax=Roseomonas xinghualingensis TaxID=2986475 RepID=UPI0021F16BA7|nr:SGNH/GDSL hydrolase family protein [Roseomonas sp. SXEYE001]MCV4206235.1 GDSL-type esterase/lipase family protein [Roseomonas sp. SXEYE001]